jgi:hypothetical protein
MTRSRYKLVLGTQKYGFWQGPKYPNASTDHTRFDRPFDCKRGCLFDIFADPSEVHDLAGEQASKLAELAKLWAQRNATSFNAPRLATSAQQCQAYAAAHGGYTGPYLDPQ